jgi:hypothetical protein
MGTFFVNFAGAGKAKSLTRAKSPLGGTRSKSSLGGTRSKSAQRPATEELLV